MVEGRCQYSLQWRVSGRLKERGELNNAQYIEWEKILVDYCGPFGPQNGGIYGRSSLFNVDRLKEKFQNIAFLTYAVKTCIFTLLFLFVIARSVLRLYALFASRNHRASLF